MAEGGRHGGTGAAPVTVIHGPESFLSERAVAEVTAAVKAAEPDVEVSETEAATIETPGSLSGLTAPSLFSASRLVVLQGAAEVAPEVGAALVEYAAEPLDGELYLVVVHGGGPKGRGWLDKLRKTKGVAQIACEKPKPRDLPGFVMAEIRSAGGRAGGDAAAALVEAVGSDLRTLAGACRQLVDDADDHTVTVELVGRYFAGRAEVSSFAVADAAVEGRTSEALQRLRWALASGVAPVLISSALATSVRRITKAKGLPPGMKSGEAAAALGVPPFIVDRTRREARSWGNRSLASAVAAVARADTDVKGGSYDVDFALERAVIDIAAARSS